MVEIGKFIFFVFGAVVLLQISLSNTSIRYRKPFSCAACLGFWIGFLVCDGFFGDVGWGPDSIGIRIMWAMIAAGTSFIFNSIVSKES